MRQAGDAAMHILSGKQPRERCNVIEMLQAIDSRDDIVDLRGGWRVARRHGALAKLPVPLIE